jgi:hypothetical protein
VHLAPISEWLDEDPAEAEDNFAVALGSSDFGLPLRQKRDKVAALDMRFQRYRKAEP